jgi:histidine triad (HIT) family protein
MPNEPPSGDRCIFCEIVARRAPAHIVSEGAKTLTFLDLFPITRGHLLIIPKAHVDRITDLPSSDYPELLGAVSQACRQVEHLSTHYNVSINQGSLAGQIVFHLHVHVIPRYEDTAPAWTKPRGRLGDQDATAVLQTLGAG